MPQSLLNIPATVNAHSAAHSARGTYFHKCPVPNSYR